MPQQRISQRYFRRPDLDIFLRSLFPDGNFGYHAQYGSYVVHAPRTIEQSEINNWVSRYSSGMPGDSSDEEDW